jgi:hypothetical protein
MDYSKLGFNEYQSVDLSIIMSLRTPEQIQEWADAVGPDDVNYGISLVHCATLALLDEEVDAMSKFPEAMSVINLIKG